MEIKNTLFFMNYFDKAHTNFRHDTYFLKELVYLSFFFFFNIKNVSYIGVYVQNYDYKMSPPPSQNIADHHSFSQGL